MTAHPAPQLAADRFKAVPAPQIGDTVRANGCETIENIKLTEAKT